MAKQLNVNLNFTADTSAAEANLASLKSELASIASMRAGKSPALVGPELQKAISSAKELNKHLSGAFDPKTGNLNLTAFQQSLTKSNQSLSTLSQNLLGAGKTGQKAFMNLQNGIAAANIQLNKTQTLLGTFATTFMNTLRWQATSSVINGISGAIGKAMAYAKDLNKTLTDIRIVAPEKSMEDMAKFAKIANKQAKELSSTTLDYAKGALIYYQQGLGDLDVKSRTDVTTKMANVTGDSTDEVSSYMTAIWNNFNKAGDESEEHFADILTKLGAETAANTTEITSALEKYTGVANTIGLSYESATAAATTLIDRMRETPEVAGTALKTIFARLEGLKLEGSTDEGGTTTDLNKYSSALKQIGIDIKDTNGEIRAADDILTDIGKKWNSGELTQDVKIATAETIAGIRQWQQFAALMDNFDFFEKYKDMAEFGSEGALQEQQDIYAESWEAASNRVKTAWQDIYSQVFDDKVFIKLTDAFAKIIESVDATVKTMGGLRGVILLISSLLLSKFSANITLGLEKGITTLTTKFGQLNSIARSVFSGKFLTNLTTANKAIKDGASLLNQESQAVLRLVQANQTLPQSFIKQASQLERINTITNQLASMGNLVSKSQREQLQNELNFVQALTKEEALANESVERQQRKVSIIQSEVNGLAIVAGRHQEISTMLEEEGLASEKLIESVIKQKSMSEAMKQTSTIMQELVYLQEEFLSLQTQGLGDAEKVTELFTNRLNLLKEEGGLHATIAEEILNSYKETTNYNDSLTISIDLLEKVVNTLTETKGSGEQLSQGMRKLVQESGKAAIATEKVENALMGCVNALTGIGSKGFSTMGQIPKMISGLSSIALSASMIGSAIKTLKDEDASVLDKFVSSTMALTFAMGTVQTVAQGVREAFTAYQASIEGLTAAQTVAKAAELGRAEATAIMNSADAASTIVLSAQGIATQKNTLALAAQNIQTALNIDKELALAIAQKIHTMSAEGVSKAEIKKAVAGMLAEKQIDKETMATMKAVIANELFGKSFVSLLLPIFGVVAALGLVAAAIYAVHKNAHLAEERFEDLRSQTNQVKEGYDNLVDSANEVHSSMESWKEHQDTLKDLTYGTQEWRQALREVNTEANNTIKSFNKMNDGLQDLDSKQGEKYLQELNRQEKQAGYDKSTTLDLEEGKDYYTDQYGERIITEAGAFKIEAVNAMTVNAAQVSLNSAQMIQNRAEENADLSSFDKRWDGKLSGTKNDNGEGYFFGLHGEEAQEYKSADASDYARQIYTAMRQDQDFTKDNLSDKNWLNEAGFDNNAVKDITENEEFKNDLFDILTQMKQNQVDEIENTKASLLDDAAVQDAIFGKNSPLSDKEKEEYGGSIQNQMSSDINVLTNQWSQSREKMQELKAGHGENYWNKMYADQNNLKYNSETGEFTKEGLDGTAEEIEVDPQEIDNLIAYTAAYEDRTKAMQHYYDLVKDTQEDLSAQKEIVNSDEWKALDQAITDAANGVEGADEQVQKFAKNLAGKYSKQLAQFLDIDEEKAGSIFDKDFIEEHKEDFQKAMHGDQEAIEDLQHAAAQEMVIDIKDNDLQDLVDNADEIAIKTGIDFESLGNDLDAINEYIGSQEFDDLEVGTEINDTGFINGINNLMTLGKEGVAKAEAIMAAAGVEPEIGYKVVKLDSGENVSDSSKVQKKIRGAIPSATLNEDGSTTVSQEDYEAFINTDQDSKADSGMSGYTIIPYIKSMKKSSSQMTPSAPPAQARTRSPGGKGGGGGGGGGRGGGRRSKPARIQTKTSKVDRYKDVTQKIEKVNRASEQLKDTQDQLYGKKRLKNMDKVNAKLKEELKYINEKNVRTRKFLELDRKRLQQDYDALKNQLKKSKAKIKIGIADFTFDSTGRINNYNTIMDKLQNELDKHVDKMNKQKNEDKQNAYKEKYIDPIEETIDGIQSLVDQYEETYEEMLS